MKRIEKVIALLLVLLMCFSLCSCKELDDRRSHHVLVQEDGSLLWKGQVYFLLPRFEELRNFMLDNDYDSMLYITKPDVPVLLNRSFYKSIAYSLGDGLLLREYDDFGSYYCREDRYDELVSVIQEDAPMTKYYYSYFEGGERKNYFLTEKQMDAIRAVLDEYDTVSPEWISTQYAITIYACDEKEWFNQFFLNIEYSDEGYYLIFSEGDFDEYVRVPEAYNSVFAEIVEMDRKWNHMVFEE